MIRINKDLKDIPKSLQGKTTNKRRNEIIENKSFKNFSVFRNRYKAKDVKEKLLEIYHHKCAYCEQYEENLHVEHYRPVSTYYWLAYSWDNLLLACFSCNSMYKSDKFAIEGSKVTYHPDFENNIHGASAQYDSIEKPKFIHPEKEEMDKLLFFNRLGHVASSNSRMQYTIDEIGLDRKALCEQRKKIYDEYYKKLTNRYYNYQETKNKNFLLSILDVIEDYRRDSIDPKNTFLAFRRYMVQHWLSK